MTIENLPLIMLRALSLTVIIECAAAWLLGIRNSRDQVTVILVNLLTNPLVVAGGAAVSVFAGYKAVLPFTIVMEILVVATEGVFYRRTVKASVNPFFLSLICNICSYAAGEILKRLLLW